MTSTLDFTEEQELLRETVRRFLAEQAPMAYVRQMYDDPRGTTDGMWQDLVRLGLTGILVPEECGGLDLGLSDMGVVLEEMGRALHPGPFLSSAVAATLAVRASGPGFDQSALLTRLASGEQIATLALFEPAQRFVWRNPITSARRTSDGGWTLTGTKVHVPDAAAADVLLIAAQTSDGLGLFVVDAKSASMQPEAVLDCTRKQATVVLEEVPATRLGEGDLTSPSPMWSTPSEPALPRLKSASRMPKTGWPSGVQSDRFRPCSTCASPCTRGSSSVGQPPTEDFGATMPAKMSCIGSH
jgi:alkylation response protein AidB-like acyl-CoA dehydrogenase